MSRRAASGASRANGARGRAGARRGPRGRVWVALALVGFVLVAVLVVWRRTVGVGRARELAQLEARRVQLEAERASLEGRIRQASGREQIGRVAQERLGLRLPADTQVVTLTRELPRELSHELSREPAREGYGAPRGGAVPPPAAVSPTSLDAGSASGAPETVRP